MALYKGTALTSLIIGKLGDNIFQRWRNLKVVKMAELSVANPNTASQLIIRNAVGLASNNWNTLLTDSQRAAWNKFASLSPNFRRVAPGIRQIIPGNYTNITGKDAYCMCAVWLATVGQPSLPNAPLTATIPTAISNLSIVYAPIPGTITYSWSIINPQPAGSYVRCWIYSPQHLWHKQILGYIIYTAGAFQAVDVAGAGGVRANWATFPLARVMGQVDIVAPTGAKSAGSNTVEIYLP